MRPSQAEHFDSKVRSLGTPLFSLVLQNKIFHLQDILFIFLTVDLATMDANSEVWGCGCLSHPLSLTAQALLVSPGVLRTFKSLAE